MEESIRKQTILLMAWQLYLLRSVGPNDSALGDWYDCIDEAFRKYEAGVQELRTRG